MQWSPFFITTRSNCSPWIFFSSTVAAKDSSSTDFMVLRKRSSLWIPPRKPKRARAISNESKRSSSLSKRSSILLKPASVSLV